MDVPHPPFVLVVEDDADTRNVFGWALELYGLDSDGAATGAEALQKVAERPPDAILLDIGLPDMDGKEVCRRLRQNPATRSTPIIAFTGHAMAHQVQAALDAGCDAVLTKPCDFEKVLGEIKRLLPLHFPPAT
jgi:two-component system cell cycle response regulator DivK